MSRVVANFDPSSLSADTFNAGFPNGVGRMVVWNESNINLLLSWGAFTTYCPAWTAMLYCVSTNDVNINWTQQSTLQVYNPPISQVVVEAYGDNETIVGTFPAALHRQTATSLVGNTETTFSATIGFGATASNIQALNIFNPANSGVTYTFHSARCFSNDATVPAANLLLKSGADLNLGTAISAVPHAGSGTPPVSTAHCTAEDVGAGHGGTTIEVLNMQQSVTEDFLNFPDSFSLAPGNNLRIALTSGSSNHVVRLTFKWSENTGVSTSTGGGGLDPLIAATVVNDDSGAGTGLIESTVSGDAAGSSVYLTNDGKLTLGNANHSGSISVASLLLALGTLTRIKSVGQTTIAQAGTSVSHGLGVIPDFVLPVHDAGGQSADVITVNYGTMTTSAFTAYSTNAAGTNNIRFLVFKF